MEKPDGLIALPSTCCPEALRQLTLRDLPGIGARTEKRLNDKGIRTMDELLALDCEQAGQLWGSVWGERLWHWLRGEDFDMSETEHLKSISHQHVLAPEMRTAEKAWAVAHKLLHKAAMRLRANGHLWASSIGLAIGFAPLPGESNAVSNFGVPRRGWKSEIKLSECQDNPTLIAAWRRLWAAPQGRRAIRPPLLHRRLPQRPGPRPPPLPQPLRRPRRRAKPRPPLAIMDQLNNKYGMSTLAPATMLTAFKAAPTRIAFHSIPELVRNRI
jgi:DNA polymerase-4